LLLSIGSVLQSTVISRCTDNIIVLRRVTREIACLLCEEVQCRGSLSKKRFVGEERYRKK